MAVSPVPVGDCLPRAWFERDALVVAQRLLGMVVVHERPGGAVRCARIVETEAYRGPTDLACHARVGRTKRTTSLFGEPGHAYVFFVYGMHDCFNVTCRAAGSGHAVLIRAAEPLCGFAQETRLDGPGRFARAMGITRALDGHDLTARPLYVCQPAVRRGRHVRVGVSARVGVAYAGAWADEPWRFFDAASAGISRPPKRSIGRVPEAMGASLRRAAEALPARARSAGSPDPDPLRPSGKSPEIRRPGR